MNDVAKAPVCMIVHAYYPLGEPRVQREAAAARRAGRGVHVVALRGRGERAKEVVDGVVIHRLHLRHKRGAGFLRMIFEYAGFTIAAAIAVVRLQRRYEFGVVHVHAPPDFLVAAAVLPRLGGARVLLDIHDLSPHMFGARFGGRAVGGALTRFLTVVERWACRFADRVVTVHEPYRRELIAHGVSPDRLDVVMNSADEALVARALQKARPRMDADFLIAYHGTINEWYGVDLIVQAVAGLAQDMPNVHALVLGEGDALGSVRRLAEELGVADRIEFSGRYVPIEEALARVSVADCGVIPNRPSTLNRFALSSKLFEYVALGLPVAVARLETLAAHFSANEVEFFEAGSAGALAAALSRIAGDREAARARAASAKHRAEAYSWTVGSEHYAAILTELVKGDRLR